MAVPGMFWLGERRAGRGPGIVLRWGLTWIYKEGGKRGSTGRLGGNSIEQPAEAKKEPLRFCTRRLRVTLPLGNNSFSTGDVTLCLLKLQICCPHLHCMLGGGASGCTKPLDEEDMHNDRDSISPPLLATLEGIQFTDASLNKPVCYA